MPRKAKKKAGTPRPRLGQTTHQISNQAIARHVVTLLYCNDKRGDKDAGASKALIGICNAVADHERYQQQVAQRFAQAEFCEALADIYRDQLPELELREELASVAAQLGLEFGESEIAHLAAYDERRRTPPENRRVNGPKEWAALILGEVLGLGPRTLFEHAKRRRRARFKVPFAFGRAQPNEAMLVNWMTGRRRRK